MKSAEDTWAEIKATTNLAALADQLKPKALTRAAVSAWAKVPAERVIELEALLGIPREQLRPDLYPARWSDL